MEGLISKTAGTEWSSSPFDKELVAMRGTWQKVETENLFNDQYNLGKIRIHDNSVVAVRNDVRDGMCRCAWCGKTMTIKEFEEHQKAAAKMKVDCEHAEENGGKPV